MANARPVYRSLDGLGKVTIAFLSLWILVNLAGTLPDLALLMSGTTLDQLLEKMNSLAKTLTGLYYMGVGAGMFLTFIGAGGFFLTWLVRARKNLDALDIHSLKFSPGWMIGWYFVPIFYLFKPYQSFREIWQASAPDRETVTPAERTTVEIARIVPLWWFCWIFSNVVDNLSVYLRTMPGADTSEAALWLRAFPIFTSFFDITAAVLTILLVVQTNRRFARKLLAHTPRLHIIKNTSDKKPSRECREGHIV